MGARIALTGGIACGKSLFAKFLSELGIQVLDADDVVHELEAPGGKAVDDICTVFGPSVRAEDGGIDRAKLAEIVFNDVDSRARLQAILFPLVRSCLLDFVSQPATLRVAVIPLLFESHWESDYDIILCVASPEMFQIHRMMTTRAYTEKQARARLAAQMPVAEKVSRAHWTIHNDSTADHLKSEAVRTVAWLLERMKDDRRDEEGHRRDSGGRGDQDAGQEADARDKEKSC